MRLSLGGTGIALVSIALHWSQPGLAGCLVKRFATLPIKLENGEPVTEGEINGRPIKLVVQSGSFYNAISAQTARDLGLSVKPISTSFEISWDGKVGPAGRANVEVLKLNGPWIVRGVNFIVGGEASNMGVIGQNILALRDVEYDFANGLVRLSVAENCLGASPVYWASGASVMSLAIDQMDEMNRMPVGTIVINGQKLPVRFDSASRSRITLAAVKKLNLPVVKDAASDGVDGGGSVRLDTVEIGGEKLQGATIMVNDLANAEAEVSMGTDFFLAHRIYIANIGRRMYFTYAGGPVLGVLPVAPAVNAATAH